MTGRRRHRALLRAGLQLLIGVTSVVGLSQEPPATPPDPFLDNFEAGIRDQLNTARDGVVELINSETNAERLAEAYGQLGALYLLYELPSESSLCLQEARRLTPDDLRWGYYLAVLDTYFGRKDDALQGLEQILKRHPADVPSLLRAGELYLGAGRADDAVRVFEAALSAAPGLAAATAGLGRAAAQQGRFEAAAQALQAALAAQPEATMLHYHLGMVYRRMGDRERAREELGKPRQKEVVFPDPLMNQLYAINVSRETIFGRGIDALARGAPDRAVQAFDQLIRMQPDDADAHFNLGMAFVELERQAQAEHHLREAIRLRDDYRDAHLNLGLLLAANGADRDAALHFGRAAEIDPKDLRARVRWANALARIGERQQAVEVLRAVLEEDPAVAPARLSLGAYLADGGDVEAASEQFREVLQLAPGARQERAEAHLRLALIATQQGDPEAALHHLQQAVDLDPDFLEAQSALAPELARRGRFTEAADAFDRVVALDPKDERSHMSRSMALLLGGDYPRARQALEESTQQLPRSIALAHLLARFLATAPDEALRDGDRALALAESIVRTRSSLEHAETLAMALAEIGRFDDAVQIQRQVLANAGGVGLAAREQRLRDYEQGRPVREPWRSSP